MQVSVSVPTPDLSPELQSAFHDLYKDRQVFAFRGDLGAGKTTIIKLLCQDLGVDSEMSSPSFSLVNEYAGESGRVLHMDLYRLKTPDELLDIGWQDYLEQGDKIFVEWPEKAGQHLPDDTVDIHISVDDSSDVRTLTITYEP